MDLLVNNKDRVISYSEIENFVWKDYDEVMTSMALRTIVKNLRRKSPVSFLENISGQGYRLNSYLK
jgi:DNA-binding response OmpR family regulator